MASDEFHYFPQAETCRHGPFQWDDFSPGALARLDKQISGWEDTLGNRTDRSDVPGDPDSMIDIAVLRRVLRTLREQLGEVRFQETQPTFHLSVAAIGMAEALAVGHHALEARLQVLPDFMAQARRNLKLIPAHFRDLGLEMLESVRAWLVSLALEDRYVRPAFDALDDLHGHLRKIPVTVDFILPPAQLDRIVRHHIGCGMGVREIRCELEQERAEMSAVLAEEGGRILPGHPWQAVMSHLPPPAPPEGGMSALYRSAIDDLGRHCAAKGLIDASLLEACPVRVAPVPPYLATIRSAAAYSMPPGHPPRGGTFYVDDRYHPDHLPHDFRLLTAHETYAGHHLLDTSRWGLPRPLRRHIEFPLFYEGWACFSEKLLFHTGFFTGPIDRFLLAKRRFWRAMRGLADLEIQTGRKTIPEAAELLTTAGMGRRQALAMVRRYALKPGYQLCYTIGMRWFERIYESWRKEHTHPADFTRIVFATGEIGLANLEKMVCRKEVCRTDRT